MQDQRRTVPAPSLIVCLSAYFAIACQTSLPREKVEGPEEMATPFEPTQATSQTTALSAATASKAERTDPQASSPIEENIHAQVYSKSSKTGVSSAYTGSLPVVNSSKEIVVIPDRASINRAQESSITRTLADRHGLLSDGDNDELDDDEYDASLERPRPEEELLDADSAKSPEEIAQLVPDTKLIEENFALCDGSIYIKEWQSHFDKQWIEENSHSFRHASKMRMALGKARSQAFLKLVFPALNTTDFDYPVVITHDVIQWMHYFQTRGRQAFVTWLRRAQDVIPYMIPVLEQQGLPKDLVYLAMIESGFNNRAFSHAKAVGPWQFMRGTARIYGLRIDDFVDERRDPAKSTAAAAQYLTNLYTMFEDWHLATASYNAGEGRVMRALRRGKLQGQSDYFSLSAARALPNETRNYIPKLTAAMIIAKSPAKFGFEVAEGSRAIQVKTLLVPRPIALEDLAQSVGLDKRVLENLNPELRVGITPPVRQGGGASESGYELKVPEASYEGALVALEQLPEPSLTHQMKTRIARRESVRSFAQRHKLDLRRLIALNPGLAQKGFLRRGQQIWVPVKLGSGQLERIASETKLKRKSSVRKAQASRKPGRKQPVAATQRRVKRPTVKAQGRF